MRSWCCPARLSLWPVFTRAKTPGSAGRGDSLIQQRALHKWLDIFYFIEGAPEPLFKGNPRETTALFTFRSDTFSLTPVANGPDLSATLFTPGTFTVYFNGPPASPAGNFANLDSFSSGKPIATFLRSTGMITGVAGSTGTPTFSAELVSGQDFVFPGQTANFANLVPNGVTVLITTSPNFVGGAGEFLIAQPFTF